MSTTRAPNNDSPSGRAQAWRLWMALVEESSRNVELERRIAELRSSKSWRLTAPLRAANTLLRGVLRHGVANPHPSAQLRPADPKPAKTSVNAGLVPNGFPFAQDHLTDAPRWLVDVTELAREDLSAGVERVTRRLLIELLISPPPAHRIEPVRLTPDDGYCLARRFLAGLSGADPNSLGPDEALEARPGDIFIGLDFCRDHPEPLAKGLASLRVSKVPIFLFIHDVLPIAHPEWFPASVSGLFVEWLKILAACADGVLCNTECTARELERVLHEAGLLLPHCGIASVTLGSDLLPVPEVPELLPPRNATATRVLTVGTVDPRKGHAQTLEAFEQLWRDGQPFEWIIAGRQGWDVVGLAQRLRGHPEAGRRLFWLEGLSDGALRALYLRSDVLLSASKGEGFGLPIVEAGRLGLPLLLRDIPVFREVAGDAATYFSGEDGETIAGALQRWRDHETGAHVRAESGWPTWEESAARLKLQVDRMLRSFAVRGATGG